MTDAQYWQERLPDVVFVAGQMGSGKDFYCDALVEHADYGKYHIVTPFKMAVAAELGITLDELETNKSKYRPALQDGARVRRETNPNCMVDLFDAEYRSGRLPKHLAVTGVRFINEAEYALANGFMVVLLDVPYGIRFSRVVSREEANLGRALTVAEVRAIEERMNDYTELEVPRLKDYCHIKLDGSLPGDLFVPTLADYYRQAQLAYWRRQQVFDPMEELR